MLHAALAVYMRRSDIKDVLPMALSCVIVKNNVIIRLGFKFTRWRAQRGYPGRGGMTSTAIISQGEGGGTFRRIILLS